MFASKKCKKCLTPFERGVASLLVVSFVLTTAQPAWALRTTETAENQSGLEELKARLLQVAGSAGLGPLERLLPAASAPIATLPQPVPVLSGLEERIVNRPMEAQAIADLAGRLAADGARVLIHPFGEEALFFTDAPEGEDEVDAAGLAARIRREQERIGSTGPALVSVEREEGPGRAGARVLIGPQRSGSTLLTEVLENSDLNLVYFEGARELIDFLETRAGVNRLTAIHWGGETVDLPGVRDEVRRSEIERIASEAGGSGRQVRQVLVSTREGEVWIGPAAGLEEAELHPALDLPLEDPYLTFDLIGHLRKTLKSSLFLKTVREQLRQKASRIPDGFLPISERFKQVPELRETLEAQGVTASDWERVIVPRLFGVADARRMRNVQLIGDVRLGRLLGEAVVSRVFDEETESEFTEILPSGIVGTTLENVILGDHVFLQDNTKIRGYVIGAGAAVYDNGILSADPGTAFGLGFEIPVGPEVGGREVKPYPEIPFEGTVRLAIDRTPAFQTAYEQAFGEYIEAARADYGYVGAGAQVSHVHRGLDLFVQDGGQVVSVPAVRNLVLLSGPADLIAAGTHEPSPELEVSERTRILGAQEVTTAIFQQGSSAESGAVVKGVEAGHGALMLEHSHALEHGKVKDAVVAPNTGVGEGEATASLLGPFIGMHHQSIAIALIWHLGLGNVGALAAVGSNHTSRMPDQEFWPGEGLFFGLQTAVKFPGDFTRAPHSIIATAVDALPQKVEMPFSLIDTPHADLPGVSNAFNEIYPGWVLTENPFTPLRNEGKYADRDRAKRHRLGRGEHRRRPFELLRPAVVNMILEARDRLRSVDSRQARISKVPKPAGEGFETVRYYTEREVPGLGKNIMTEPSREAGIKAYTFALQLYALKGLLAELEKLESGGRIDPEAVDDLLSNEDMENVRWEHERRVLLGEFPVLRSALHNQRGLEWPSLVEEVSTVLSDLPYLQDRQASLVANSRKKDDIRGGKTLAAYADAHPPAEEDKFVKKMAKEAKNVRLAVQRVVKALEAGLEEPVTVTPTQPAVPLEQAPIMSIPDLRSALQSALSDFRGVPSLPAAGVPAQKAFVVSPDGVPKFAAVADAFGFDGERVVADVLAEDALHKDRLKRAFADLGLRGVTVHNLANKPYNGNVSLAVAALIAKHEQAGRAVQAVTAETGLTRVARFLGIPTEESFIRSLELIAARSNEFWS